MFDRHDPPAVLRRKQHLGEDPHERHGELGPHLQLLVRREFSCDETWHIGGLLVLRVILIDAAGVASAGTLTMVNPEGHFFAQETVTLKVHDWGLSFDRPLGAENDIIFF